jgi:hypothetical protein
MKKATPKKHGGPRPGSGRKPTGKDPVRTMRLSDEFIALVDAWAAKQDGQPSRSEAIRRLVEIGLGAVKVARAQKRSDSPTARDLAAVQIDRLADSGAPAEEQASRKRHLLKGPEEFREARVDRPKAKK